MTIHHKWSIRTEASTIDEAVDIILNSRKKRMTWQDNVGPEGKLKSLRALERGRENARRKRNVWNPATGEKA